MSWQQLQQVRCTTPPATSPLLERPHSLELPSGLAWLTRLPLPPPPTPSTSRRAALRETKRSKGIAYVQFQVPEDAVRAAQQLDGTIFQGRLLHILAAKRAPGSGASRAGGGGSGEGGAGEEAPGGIGADAAG